MRSFLTTALYLSLIHISVARIPHSFRELIDRDAEPEVEEHGLLRWFANLFKRATADTCYEDGYYDFVSGLGPNFCHQYLVYPNVTTTVDYTPTSTYTRTFTTRVFTSVALDRVTPLSTVTVTVTPGASQGKRDAEPEITERALSQMEIDAVFQMYRRQNAAASTSDNVASMSSAFSSACSCQDYAGPTVTATYTDAPVVTTLNAFGRTQTTVHTTTTAAASVVTQTVIASPPSSSSSSMSGSASVGVPGTEGSTQTSTTSSSASTPTSPPFTCPEDNNTVVSQMLGNERFDYRVLCDTVLMDSNFYDGPLNYNSFSECVAACSYADANFDSPVCQGVSFYGTGSGSSGNCYLKSSSNLTSPASGTDSALLVRIALGITNTTTAGTTTEAAPFSGETMTQDPQQMSSSMESMLSNSSFTMPMVTPFPSIVQSGMLVNAPGAVYSTYVSAGSTFSSGTAYSFSTHYSNGSWYYSYFTSFTVAWASATTVYESSQTGQSVADTSNTDTTEQSGPNGENIITHDTNYTSYGGGWMNTTEVISQETYDQNGTEISSTAITHYYNTQTAVGGGASGIAASSGGANGGSNGGAAGTPASGSPITSTFTFSTETVIINSGGTGGSSGEVGSGGPAPSTLTSTTVQSFGSAYSSGFVASGGSTGTGAASGGFGSGGPVSGAPGPSTSATTIVETFGTAYSSGFVASGGSAGTGGASSGFGSSGPGSGGPGSGSPGPSTSATTIVETFGTAYSSGFVASGGSAGTGGASSVVGSGGPGSAPTVPVSVIINSAGTNGVSSLVASGGPTGTGGASSTAASGGPSSRFTDTGVPRSGTISGSTSIGTGGESSTAASGRTASGRTALGRTASGRTSSRFTDTGVPRSGTISGSTSVGTGGASSTAASGRPSSSFTNTDVPRSGTISESLPVGTGTPSGSLPIPVLNSTGGVYTGIPPSTSPSTAPIISITSTSTISVSFSGPPRSGTIETSSSLRGTAPSSPSGTAPTSSRSRSRSSHGTLHPFPSSSLLTGTAATGTASSIPSGPLPNGPSPYPSSNETATPLPSGSAPTPPTVTAPGTGPVAYPSTRSTSSGHFSNESGNRSPYPSSSRSHDRTSQSTPSGTAPSGTAPSVPSGTAPLTASSGLPHPLLNTTIGTAPLSTGTLSTGAPPGIPHNHGPNQPVPPPSTSPATAPLSIGTSPASVAIPSAPRNGTISTTPSATLPPLSTLPASLTPPNTCGNMTLGTTTILSTTTIYGCYSSCLPWGSYGSGPQSFGPPFWAQPTGT